MNARARFLVAALQCAAVLAPLDASAIPAFARKYGTSCLTCHTVYPKLTPFGEAFRRNGFRFPGVDSDYVKQDTVALGQEASKKTFPKTVWPASIPASVPLALGVNGTAFAFPDKHASVPRQNGGAQLSMDDLVEEGHLWVGAALDDTITLFGELTFSSEGAHVEHAQVLFNDLVGPKHALNVVVGRGPPTLTSFGAHSTYLGDSLITAAPITGIYGLSSEPFMLVDHYTGVEANGVMEGRADWSAGVTAVKTSATGVSRFNSENAYAHAGLKLGGMRLDGEGSQGPQDAMRPWAEDALTLDLYVFHAREYFDAPEVTPPVALGDTSFTFGGNLRGQLASAELNLGAYGQKHDRGTATLSSVRAAVGYAELSYVLFPWMVPAIRAEAISIRPAGGPRVNDWHLMPGVAFLVRPNVKAVLVANFEFTDGFPTDASGGLLGWSGGNGDAGGFVAAPKDTSTATSRLNEVESIALFLAWAI